MDCWRRTGKLLGVGQNHVLTYVDGTRTRVSGASIPREGIHVVRVVDSPMRTMPGLLATNRRMADGESAPLMMAAYSGGSRQLRCVRRPGSCSICNWAKALSAVCQRRRARRREIRKRTAAAIATTARISRRGTIRIVCGPKIWLVFSGRYSPIPCQSWQELCRADLRPLAAKRHRPAQGVRRSDSSRIIVRSKKSGRELARWANFFPGFPSSDFSANSAIQLAFR